MIPFLRIACALGLALGCLSGCGEDGDKSSCKSRYGKYIAVSNNGDMAVDACKDGRFGILVRYNGKDRWLQPEGIRYMSPSFSHDGRKLVFVGLDPGNKQSSIHILDLDTGADLTILESHGVIAHAVLDKSNTSIVYWQGQYREAGKTPANRFMLHRLMLESKQSTAIDGPYPLVGRPTFDEDGTLYYSYENVVDGKLHFGATRCNSNASQCAPVQLESIGGDLAHTPKGYYYIVLYDQQGRYRYCIRGPGLPDKTICSGNKFSVSPAGTWLGYVDAENDEARILSIQ